MASFKNRRFSFSAFIQKYIFNEQLPLEARVGNMIYLVGLGTAIAALITRIVMGSSLILVLTILGMNLSLIGVMFLANRFKLYRICRFLIVIMIGFVLFPMAFFALGGINSAMSGYFVLSIVLIFSLTSGKSRIIILVAHILETVTCYFLSSRPPFNAFVAPVNDSYRYLDHVQTFVVVGISIGLMIVFVHRLYNEEKEKARKAQEALLARDAILRFRLKQQELMSDISQSFISKDPTAFLVEDALKRMGEFLKVTRVLVAADPILTESRPVYCWSAGEEWKPNPAQAGFNETINAAFPKIMPVKGSVPTVYCEDTLTESGGRYRIFHETLGLKSFAWAPLYIDALYWGMISIEEYEKTRVWTDSDAQLVGTVSSAIAGAIARDIMEKARAAALEQAVQASKAKGDFLSNMSHEMRTPMNAIIGMTSIGKSAPDMEKKNYAFGKIEDASTHLLGVINDILDMSKIEANKLELSPVNFEFEAMLQKVVNVINFRMDQRQQSFYVTIDKKIPNSLIGDDQRLAQVITNLLSNAVKFTPELGTIRLNAHYAGEEGDKSVLRIEVIDSGIGISAEQQARLFTSFEQAETNTTRKFGGTGLGLSISKRIVELMEGNIWIESELGHGSTFAFTVKMQKGSVEKKIYLNPGVNWSNVKILAVDDDEEILQYFAEMMGNFGINCDLASGGIEALKRTDEKGGYDIYFIDWKMPGMNGLELSKKIKERDDGKSVVTMISGVEWSTIEADAKKAGVDRFIAKPLFPSAIADLINECLGVDYAALPGDGLEDQDGCFAGSTIILAEDVEINREIVITLLESTGIAIDCAENGAIAVDMFKNDPDKYDMIFMDVQMPEMDGYEATRAIRAFEAERFKNTNSHTPIPIVAMTANVFREDIEKSLAAGMNDHLGKPFGFAEVLAKLRKYLPKEGNGEAGGDTGEVWKNGVAWSPALSMGNAEIDSQHKQIFRLASNLVKANKHGEDPAFLKDTLDFLVNYTVKHFNDEEALASRCNFPGYRDHKKLHDDFRITVAQLSAEYDARGSSKELWDRVTATVAQWVVQHIKQQDMKLAGFLRKGTADQGSDD
ncbi:hypothetical protein AGMMS50268_10230 [Spirochaetia bacterium]|nr:hypothetical protein AGMMS50268_10230 [Spirochaetia bacterium]